MFNRKKIERLEKEIHRLQMDISTIFYINNSYKNIITEVINNNLIGKCFIDTTTLEQDHIKEIVNDYYMITGFKFDENTSFSDKNIKYSIIYCKCNRYTNSKVYNGANELIKEFPSLEISECYCGHNFKYEITKEEYENNYKPKK